MLAVMLGEPIIAIESEQGELLAKSLVDIAEHYGLAASKTVMVWIQLGGTCAMIYGPKVMQIARRPKKQAPQNGIVTSINSGINFGNVQ